MTPATDDESSPIWAPIWSAMERLFSMGSLPEMDPKRVQRVRLVNQVAVFVALLLLPYAAVFTAFGSLRNALIQVLAIVALAAAVGLNGAGRHNTARALTLVVGNGHVALMMLLLGPDAGVYLYAFAAVVAPLFFYPDREWGAIGVYVGMTLLSAVGAQAWVMGHAPVDPLPDWFSRWFFLMNLGGGLLTVFAFVLYFYVESRRYESSLLFAHHELVRLAESDPLTGVANRRKLESTLLLEWGRAVRSKQAVAVVLIDVDHFKRFNDRYGHPAGDLALVRVCVGFRAGVRRVYDVVGRYGGEEFLLILPETTKAGALRVAERARDEVWNLEIPHADNDEHGRVTCSFGVACLPAVEGGDPFELVRMADRALYEAKAQGRNRVVLATPSG